MKTYQIFFNKRFGYRADYKASFWYYIGLYIKKFIDFDYYGNGIKIPTNKRVQILGVRGGKTGNYHTIKVMPKKPTHEKISVSFLRWFWFGTTLELSYSRFVYFQCNFSITFHKIKSTFKLEYSNI